MVSLPRRVLAWHATWRNRFVSPCACRTVSSAKTLRLPGVSYYSTNIVHTRTQDLTWLAKRGEQVLWDLLPRMDDATVADWMGSSMAETNALKVQTALSKSHDSLAPVLPRREGS